VDNPALPERRRFPRFAAQDGESRAFAHIPTGNHNQPEFLNRFKEVDEADRPTINLAARVPSSKPGSRKRVEGLSKAVIKLRCERKNKFQWHCCTR
jgi:hypothetical protein